MRVPHPAGYYCHHCLAAGFDIRSSLLGHSVIGMLFASFYANDSHNSSE
jgi:4-hydroxybenzoate polyprenyltransferase